MHLKSDLPVVFSHVKLGQAQTAARPADATPGVGFVQGAVGGANQIAPGNVEEPAVIPVERDSAVRTTVEIGIYPVSIADGEGRMKLSADLDGETNPFPVFYEVTASANDATARGISHR